MPAAKPPVKMVGGKTKLLPELLARLPSQGFGRYFEPFVGGGALFFALSDEDRTGAVGWWMTDAFVSDSNIHLVRAYNGIRDDVRGVIEMLGRMPNTEEHFYRVRYEWDPDYLSPAEQAAWFVYLNKTCFNGLFRVNRAGRFNVPYGDNPRARICDEENLRAVSRVLGKHAPVRHVDFEEAVTHATKGDVVYADPPYIPVSATSNFTSYTALPFGDAEHVRLRDLAARLKERGVFVMLSNADVPRVRELYDEPRFKVDCVQARRSINAIGGRRGFVGEVIVT